MLMAAHVAWHEAHRHAAFDASRSRGASASGGWITGERPDPCGDWAAGWAEPQWGHGHLQTLRGPRHGGLADPPKRAGGGHGPGLDPVPGAADPPVDLPRRAGQ